MRDPKGGPRDGWATSRRLAAAVHELLGPVFDPCWNPWSPILTVAHRVQGDRDADDPDPEPWPATRRDALSESLITTGAELLDVPSTLNWHLNPPFSSTAAWLERLVSELERSPQCSATVITLDDPSVQWFDRHWTHASAICFPNKREAFEPPPGIEPSSFNMPIVIALYSDSRRKRTAFMKRFSEFGTIATQWRR